MAEYERVSNIFEYAGLIYAGIVMFSGAFSSGFAGRGASVAGGFAGAFAGVFAGRGAAVGLSYIGPMVAQRALVDGASVVLSRAGLLIGGRLLIGPAGKVYAFKSAESAALWVDNARNIGLREADLIPRIAAAAAGAWKEKKRAKLAVIAGRVVDAAARQRDEKKREALLAEADYCLAKWGG